MARTSTALRRRPRFNAKDYRSEAMDLIKTNPELAADSMTKLAGRKVRAENQVAEADNSTRDLGAAVISFALLSATGWWLGSMEAKRDLLVADWELEGAADVGANLQETPYPWDHERGVADPTTFFFVPKLLVVPVVSGAIAGIISASRPKGSDPGTWERGFTITAISSFGLMLAKVVGRFAYERKRKKMLADPNSVVSVVPAVA